ncbi:hypothetical protein NDA12_000483 [Ustilago hordei]|nr:hypothetical protein NDA12_000483 [Ustilago hordei]
MMMRKHGYIPLLSIASDAAPVLSPESTFCHGPGCSRSRRVTGSYGRSTGIEDLVEISREHGRSAVSMETMDSYGLTCKGGPSTATRRTKLKEQAQPRRGPSSRSMQMVTTQGLERQEPKELSLIKGEGAVSKELTPGHEEEEQCRRSRVTGSYGRSTGIEDLVDTSREHGRSAVSMETMDSYGLTCKGGPSTATRRTKLKEQAQPRGGPSSDGYHSGARETRVIGHWQAGPEEEEQCRGSRHQVMRRRSSVEGVDTAQEAQGCQAGEAPEQYSMEKVLSGERAGAASLVML